MSAAAVTDAVTGGRRGPGAWSISVGAAFLEPYRLTVDNSLASILKDPCRHCT
jgi:hypothetical protein